MNPTRSPTDPMRTLLTQREPQWTKRDPQREQVEYSSRWAISRLVCIGHVMLFVSLSFALGTQHKKRFLVKYGPKSLKHRTILARPFYLKCFKSMLFHSMVHFHAGMDMRMLFTFLNFHAMGHLFYVTYKEKQFLFVAILPIYNSLQNTHRYVQSKIQKHLTVPTYFNHITILTFTT